MRIVVTKNGKIIVQELEEEPEDNNNSNNNNNISNYYKIKSLKYNQSSSYSKLPIISSNEELFKKYISKNNEFLNKVLRYRETFQSKRSSSIIDKNALESFYNRDESKINMNELNQARKIVVSHPKINMSQAFLDKYDDLDMTFKKRLNDLSNGLISHKNTLINSKDKSIKEDNKNNDMKIINNGNKNLSLNGNINFDSNNRFNSSVFSNQKKKINLGQIISSNNLINLRKQISKYNQGHDDIRMPLNEENTLSFNFRSKYENKQATEDDMDLILNYTINPDKQSIIKYFQQNKNISPYYFENLIKYDEPQMYRLNKICQMILHRKENEKKNLGLKFFEMNEKDKFNKQKGSRNLKALQGIIKKSNSILNDYTMLQNNHNFWRKNGYQDDVMKVKEKYWDKYNVNRFLKNQQKNETMISADRTMNKKFVSSQSSPNIFSKTKI